MQETAIDPETGAIDMDIINTGISNSRRTLRSDLAKELREMLLRTFILALLGLSLSQIGGSLLDSHQMSSCTARLPQCPGYKQSLAAQPSSS